MEWPQDLVERMGAAYGFSGPGKTDDAVRWMLDESAKHAVWRAMGNPAQLEAAYALPYTPLGHAHMRALGEGKVTRMAPTAEAIVTVDSLHAFVRSHAAEICSEFASQALPYDDLSGRAPADD